jgi:hypothetical protein
MKRAGTIALLAFLAALGGSLLASHSQRPDVAGIVQLYANGAIVVETSTAGLREIHVDPTTVVRDFGDRPGRDAAVAGRVASLADLRPGRWVAAWWREGLHPVPVAGRVDVWGRGR